MSFPQPRGRPRKGCYWNTTRGSWVPSVGQNTAVRVANPSRPPPSVDPTFLAKRALEEEERLNVRQRRRHNARRTSASRQRSALNAFASKKKRTVSKISSVGRSGTPLRQVPQVESCLPAPCHIYYMTPGNCVYGVDEPRHEHKPLDIASLLAEAPRVRRSADSSPAKSTGRRTGRPCRGGVGVPRCMDLGVVGVRVSPPATSSRRADPRKVQCSDQKGRAKFDSFALPSMSAKQIT